MYGIAIVVNGVTLSAVSPRKGELKEWAKYYHGVTAWRMMEKGEWTDESDPDAWRDIPSFPTTSAVIW